ncbi:MAG TPA: DUF2877 domain-containing protein [Negativicutes bacterium]|nr:DUF2877 domain-containing protein [Negativicutes bacterium]
MLIALSVDAAAAGALFGRPFRGRVHSVFARAINLTGPRGRLYCLAAEELDDAPDTVRVRHTADAALDELGVRPGDDVATTACGLACGPVAVSAAGVRPWTAALPAFPSGPEERRRLAANLAVLRAVIAAEGRDGGLKAYIAGTAGNLFEQELAARAADLAGPLTCGDMPGVLAAGRRIVGLGPGLTPAGDDFLAGLMITFNMPAGPFGGRYRRTAAALAAEAATGTVSRAMLAHAARGRTRAGAVALLAALAEGGSGEVAAAARAVLAGGATSGTDLAAGLAVGLEIGLQLAG